jgi:glycosyltransferase involved in cell wall biosynthesis
VKRILFFGHTAKLGGGEIALLNVVQQLDRTRFHPSVLLASDGPLREKLQTAGVETRVLPLDAGVVETRKDSLGGNSLLRLGAVWHTLAYILRLAKFIRRHPLDVVHTNSLKADIIGGIAARLAGVPVLWHVRDRIDEDYLPPRVVKVFRWLCRWLPTYLIANSQATLDTLKLTRRNSAVVHDGFPGDLESRSTFTSDIPVIGLVGRITEWKGQHIFIEAAATVRRKFPQVRFQIIGSAMFGEAAYETRLREMVRELGLEDCTEFSGFRADVQELIERLTILVHASTTGEPFGQVVIEGMAAGKPVVATNGGGIPEIVVDGVTGMLVPMGEASPMAEAIVRLLADPASAEAMGRAGRQRVASHFTIRHTARKLEAIYETIPGVPDPRCAGGTATAHPDLQRAQPSTLEGNA